MNNLFLVAIADSRKKLLHDSRCDAFVEMLRFQNQIKQLPSFQVLGDQVDIAIVRVHFVQLHNIWVVKLFEDLDFVRECRQVVVVALVLFDDLHCSDVSSEFVNNFLHFSEAALPEEFHDLVVFADLAFFLVNHVVDVDVEAGVEGC